MYVSISQTPGKLGKTEKLGSRRDVKLNFERA